MKKAIISNAYDYTPKQLASKIIQSFEEEDELGLSVEKEGQIKDVS